MPYELNEEIGIMELQVHDSASREEVAESMATISRLSGETGIELLIEKLQFGETVGVNRGIPVRLFSSESEAIDWLKGG